MGPRTTDSYRATEYWLKSHEITNYEIVESTSFEEVFGKVEKDQYIVMPIGYCDRSRKEFKGWVDYHFRFYRDLDIIDLFKLSTKEMVLVENTACKTTESVLQAATYQLARSSSVFVSDDVSFRSSKVMALDDFLKDKYKYTICSKDVYEGKNMENNEQYVIRDSFSPEMIWVVYKVTGVPERIVIE